MFFPSFFETTNKLQIHVVLYKWFMLVSNNTLGTKVDAYIDRGNISKTCINNQELKRIDILWHPSMHNMLFESHKSLHPQVGDQYKDCQLTMLLRNVDFSADP